ncbi:HAMP domain-containing sensor histidine kinase [Nocardioides sp. SOB77]|uniref:histidine kinase n=2 Tax=Nocardioides TaxID=1839 RepID=A0ABT8FLV1_9ACTN|nr:MULTISPECIES: HAMP domain-containing sensor histidine kinase [Nocardioides]MDN4175604.1 HAMP domain-containing sensor histidine kinase [Nocardioides oceani]MDO3398085.1 HAMP domain-containing sensor histidine kinase [Nocardioides cremeus]
MLTVVMVSALAVTVFFLPMALLVRQHNQHTDLLELQKLAVSAAHEAPTDLQEPGVWRPPDADPEHRYALYDSTGRRITGDGPDIADAAVRAALRDGVAGVATDTQIIAATALGSGAGQMRGAVRVTEPAEESAARTTGALAWMAALALGAVLVAALAGWWLLRRLLGPVNALRAAAERLGQGDFTVTLPDTGLPEIDDVGRALTASAERIGGLVERERRFSADASHQLRTPLAATIVALETELIAPRPDPRTVLFESLEALGGLEARVTELLHLARDTPGPRPPIDLHALLDELSATWGPRYRAHDRSLQVQYQDPPEVRASEAALRHILDVLLANALRHGEGDVVIGAAATAGGVTISVTDQGPGPTRPDTLFERRDSQAVGTGIGLALARSLAEAEGARLTLRDIQPTTFELLIPSPAQRTEDWSPAEVVATRRPGVMISQLGNPESTGGANETH